MAVNPNLTTIAVHPMAGPPDIIIASNVIAGAPGIIWPVAYLNCDPAGIPIAWIPIAGIAVTGTILSVTRSVARVTRIAAIVFVGASSCSTRNKNQ